MANEMKVKFDKYWGKLENMNPIIFIANALDPRYKLAYITWSFEGIYGAELAENMVKNVKGSMVRMYDWYATQYGKPISSATNTQGAQGGGDTSTQGDLSLQNHAQKARNAAFKSHLKKKDTIEAKNELERYLNEPCIDHEGDTYDVLGWWKMNSSRFEVLSKMARDVLAVPVSIVTSESAFSMGVMYWMHLGAHSL